MEHISRSVDGVAGTAAARDTDEQPRTSRWAIAALAASLGIFCPLLTLMGPLLAVRALVETRAHPSRRGRGLAVAALWIGLASTAGWAGFFWWWNANVRHLLQHGPQTALLAGYAGDMVGFRDQFIGDGAQASDARVSEFIAQLRERHGRFIAAAQDAMVSAPAQDGSTSVTIPYLLSFESGDVRSEARILLFADYLMPRLQAITVKDEHGVIEFPSNGAASTP
jgi:hypothetical protein